MHIQTSTESLSCSLSLDLSSPLSLPPPPPMAPSAAELLAAKRVFFNAARYRQWTALTLSACSGSADALHVLLATGLPDLTTLGGCGLPPLGCAVKAAIRHENTTEEDDVPLSSLLSQGRDGAAWSSAAWGFGGARTAAAPGYDGIGLGASDALAEGLGVGLRRVSLQDSVRNLNTRQDVLSAVAVIRASSQVHSQSVVTRVFSPQHLDDDSDELMLSSRYRAQPQSQVQRGAALQQLLRQQQWPSQMHPLVRLSNKLCHSHSDDAFIGADGAYTLYLVSPKFGLSTNWEIALLQFTPCAANVRPAPGPGPSNDDAESSPATGWVCSVSRALRAVAATVQYCVAPMYAGGVAVARSPEGGASVPHTFASATETVSVTQAELCLKALAFTKTVVLTVTHRDMARFHAATCSHAAGADVGTSGEVAPAMSGVCNSCHRADDAINTTRSRTDHALDCIDDLEPVIKRCRPHYSRIFPISASGVVLEEFRRDVSASETVERALSDILRRSTTTYAAAPADGGNKSRNNINSGAITNRSSFPRSILNADITAEPHPDPATAEQQPSAAAAERARCERVRRLLLWNRWDSGCTGTADCELRSHAHDGRASDRGQRLQQSDCEHTRPLQIPLPFPGLWHYLAAAANAGSNAGSLSTVGQTAASVVALSAGARIVAAANLRSAYFKEYIQQHRGYLHASQRVLSETVSVKPFDLARELRIPLTWTEYRAANGSLTTSLAPSAYRSLSTQNQTSHSPLSAGLGMRLHSAPSLSAQSNSVASADLNTFSSKSSTLDSDSYAAASRKFAATVAAASSSAAVTAATSAVPTVAHKPSACTKNSNNSMSGCTGSSGALRDLQGCCCVLLAASSNKTNKNNDASPVTNTTPGGLSSPHRRGLTSTAPSCHAVGALPRELASPWRSVTVLAAHGAPLVLPRKYGPLSVAGVRALHRGVCWGGRGRVWQWLCVLVRLAQEEQAAALQEQIQQEQVQLQQQQMQQQQRQQRQQQLWQQRQSASAASASSLFGGDYGSGDEQSTLSTCVSTFASGLFVDVLSAPTSSSVSGYGSGLSSCLSGGFETYLTPSSSYHSATHHSSRNSTVARATSVGSLAAPEVTYITDRSGIASGHSNTPPIASANAHSKSPSNHCEERHASDCEQQVAVTTVMHDDSDDSDCEQQNDCERAQQTDCEQSVAVPLSVPNALSYFFTPSPSLFAHAQLPQPQTGLALAAAAAADGARPNAAAFQADPAPHLPALFFSRSGNHMSAKPSPKNARFDGQSSAAQSHVDSVKKRPVGGLSQLPFPALLTIAVYAGVGHINDINTATGATVGGEISMAETTAAKIVAAVDSAAVAYVASANTSARAGSLSLRSHISSVASESTGVNGSVCASIRASNEWLGWQDECAIVVPHINATCECKFCSDP